MAGLPDISGITDLLATIKALSDQAGSSDDGGSSS